MNHSFFVIEDHTLTNLGIRDIIKNNTDFSCAGYASDESEAFEKLTELDMKGQLPQILILDLFLGKDSGIDVLREVTKHFPSIKVLVYSMYSNSGIVNLVLENGAKAFVSKTSQESELVQAIKMITSGECQCYIQPELIEPLRTYNSIFASLTHNEKNVLNKIIERKDLDAIASELDMEKRTVETYFSRICAKSGCKNYGELIERFA